MRLFGVSLGEGNTKVGDIFTFSLPALATCPGASPWCLKHCYAYRYEQLRPVCRRAYQRNLVLAQRPAEFVRLLTGVLPRILPCMRIHVSGDFHNAQYCESWRHICAAFPQTKFWAYTRSWTVPALYPALNQLRTLPNVELIASTDPTMSLPPKGWRTAFIETDARATGMLCKEQTQQQGAGCGENLYNFFLEVLRTHLSIKKVLLQKFATKRKVDRFKQTVNRSRIGVSPVPIQPSKRDLVLLAAGVPSLHYHNRVSKASTEDRGLAVYLDVSGSVNQHLPRILGILQSLKRELLSVFLFSNKVAEVPFKTLLKGHVQTTYGTDFDCIAESILERAFDKAVILTDGYASMSEANRDKLKERAFTALTVLFGGKTDCPEFGRFGDVVQLEEVTN